MRRRVAGAGAAVFLAAVWAVAAYLLWRSKVPSSLNLPHIDTAAAFRAGALHRAASFDRGASLLWVAGVVVELVLFTLYAWRGEAFARESAAGPIGTGMLLGMLGFALLWLANLPVAVLETWWERRYGVSHTSYGAAVFGGWLALGVKFVLLCAALGVVMGLARLVGHSWWVLGAPAFVALAALFAFVSPYLVATHPLHDRGLRAAVAALERREHVDHVTVRVENVSSETSLPNAEAAGFGPSRHIIIWNTLLDGRFSSGEVRVVLAHELGHLARNHILKGIGWYTLFAFPETFLISLIVRRRGGMGEPAAVPLALLAFVVLGLVTLPIQNLISRHREAEADWLALQTTHDPGDATALFKTFVGTALSNPNPPTWEYLFLYDHPTVDQRVAMVEAWQQRLATPRPPTAAR
jgi:STE24 endopeptidase